MIEAERATETPTPPAAPARSPGQPPRLVDLVAASDEEPSVGVRLRIALDLLGAFAERGTVATPRTRTSDVRLDHVEIQTDGTAAVPAMGATACVLDLLIEVLALRTFRDGAQELWSVDVDVPLAVVRLIDDARRDPAPDLFALAARLEDASRGIVDTHDDVRSALSPRLAPPRPLETAPAGDDDPTPEIAPTAPDPIPASRDTRPDLPPESRARHSIEPPREEEAAPPPAPSPPPRVPDRPRRKTAPLPTVLPAAEVQKKRMPPWLVRPAERPTVQTARRLPKVVITDPLDDPVPLTRRRPSPPQLETPAPEALAQERAHPTSRSLSRPRIEKLDRRDTPPTLPEMSRPSIWIVVVALLALLAAAGLGVLFGISGGFS